MRRGFGHRPHSGFPGRETFPAYGSQSVNTTGWLLIEASGDKPKSSGEKGPQPIYRPAGWSELRPAGYTRGIPGLAQTNSGTALF